MEERNRHPIDRLADVQSEIRRLEAELRPICSNTPMTGKVWNTSLPGEQRRKRVDLKALADEIGASLLPIGAPYSPPAMC